MRHDLLPRPISTGSRCMRKAAAAACLIASARFSQPGLARRPSATAPAVDLAAVAAAANQHLRLTAGAQEHPASVGHRRFGAKAEARWTPRASDAILSVARASSRSPPCGARRRATCQGGTVVALCFSSARRLSGPTGANQSRAHRFGDRPSRSRFGMQPRAAGLQASGPAGRKDEKKNYRTATLSVHEHLARRNGFIKLGSKYPRFLAGNYTRLWLVNFTD